MTDFLSHMEYRLQDGVSDDALAAAAVRAVAAAHLRWYARPQPGYVHRMSPVSSPALTKPSMWQT